MNIQSMQNKDMGDNIFGDKEHQEVAREALPILIEKAKAGETINYGDLAHKLDIPPTGYPMSKMLDSIVTTLYELGVEWQENLPCLTALVVKRSTGYPGFPTGIGDEVFDAEFDRIHNYREWDAVQKKLLPVYNHKDSPLNKLIVKELICELYLGKGYVKRSVIIEEIRQYHLDQGGKKPEIKLSVAVSNVLREMAHAGTAERREGSHGFWRILPSVEQVEERDISEGLKALEERIARLEKVVLLVLSSEIGNYVSGSAKGYLRFFQSFPGRKVELLRKEYGTLEEAIENFLNIAEEKSGYR